MNVLSWFADPTRYWALAIVVLCFWILYVVASSSRRDSAFGWRDRTAFCVLSFAVILAFRWPLLFIPGPLYPDESQMGAQAITAVGDWLPWHGFDGGTAGPMDSYMLTLPMIFGGHLTAGWIRFIAMLIGATIVCVFAIGAEAIGGVRIGRAATVVPLGFFGLMTSPDPWHYHYSTETLPALLIAIALGVMAFAALGRAGIFALVAAGGCVALIPFAKLQAAPIAAALFVMFVALPVFRAPPNRAKERFAFIGGWLGTSALFLGAAAAGGSLSDAYVRYITVSLVYKDAMGSLGPLQAAADLVAASGSQAFAIGILVLLLLAAIGAFAAKLSRFSVRTIAAVGALTVVSGYCATAPHRAYSHYLTLAALPVSALIAVLLVAADSHSASLPRWARPLSNRYFPIALCTALILIPTLALRAWDQNPFLAVVSTSEVPDDPVISVLRSETKPGSTISIWGWASQYYVYTNTRMATKDATAYYDIVPGQYQDYFRTRFMTSFLANRPRLFVDAVAPSSFAFTDRAAFGFETFPALRDEVERQYVLQTTIHGVRIYRRRADP